MRSLLWLVAASIGCAGVRSSSPPRTAPIEGEPPATNGEETARDDDETKSDDDAAADLDFSEDAAAPSAATSAPPQRRPPGAFELCGDKCRDNTELKKSLEDVDDDE